MAEKEPAKLKQGIHIVSPHYQDYGAQENGEGEQQNPNFVSGSHIRGRQKEYSYGPSF